MTTEAEPRRSDGEARSRPLLFISHRHADRQIADVIREFVTLRSAGDVIVHQSSSSDAAAPKIGQNINQELKRTLWRTDVLLLVYTKKDQDWDYCMWECGVAMHAESEDTNVIVLQCGRQLPRVFADQVGVDMRDPEKVRGFVNHFLTDESFFPGRNEAVSRFQPNDANVTRAAEDLFAELQRVIVPDVEDDQLEEWPAVPFVRLGLDPVAVRDITDEPDDDAALQTAAGHLLEARVLLADREAAALFGRPTLPADDAFGQVLRRVIRDGQRPEWLASLADQVMRAAQWNFPTVRWGLLRSANPNDGTWYSPVLTHVRRYPDKSMEFDVHFQRFACPAGEAAISLPLPPEAEAQPAAG